MQPPMLSNAFMVVAPQQPQQQPRQQQQQQFRPAPPTFAQSVSQPNLNLLAQPVQLSGQGPSAVSQPQFVVIQQQLPPQQQQMPQQQQQAALPAAALMQPGQQQTLPRTGAHLMLGKSCAFVRFPTNLPTEPATDPSRLPDVTAQLFVGQVKFETTAAELRWLIGQTCGLSPVRIDTRGPGCFIVHMPGMEEGSVVCQTLHKRVLFDLEGAWFARTAAEVASMAAYVTTSLRRGIRGLRLPRDTMVVEPSSEPIPSMGRPTPANPTMGGISLGAGGMIPQFGGPQPGRGPVGKPQQIVLAPQPQQKPAPTPSVAPFETPVGFLTPGGFVEDAFGCTSEPSSDMSFGVTNSTFAANPGDGSSAYTFDAK